MGERVGIHTLKFEEEIPESEQLVLVDLTMTIRERERFHDELKEMGYCVGEGRSELIDGTGEQGTIFSIFRIIDGRRTNQKVGEMSTFLDINSD